MLGGNLALNSDGAGMDMALGVSFCVYALHLFYGIME